MAHGQQLRQHGQIEQQEFKSRRRFRALHNAALRIQRHLPGGVQVRGGKTRRDALPQGGFVSGQAQARQHGLAALTQKKKIAQVARQFADEKAYVHALLQYLATEVGHGCAVLRVQGREKIAEHFLSGQAKHLPCGGCGQFRPAEGQGLIQQGHAVAHAASGPAGQQAHGAFFKVDAFLAQHAGKMLHQRVFAQMAKNKMLAAAHNGDGKFVRFRGGEDEDHALRRLFQRFEQGIEGVARKHVGFVDDEDLVAAFHGGVADGFAQGAGVFDAVVGSAVDFGDVHMDALRDLAALGAFIAGFRAGRVLAVEGLGENSGYGGLAHAASAAQKIGGGGPVLGCGAGKDGLDHVLSRHLGKGLGAVARCEGKMLHVFLGARPAGPGAP